MGLTAMVADWIADLISAARSQPRNPPPNWQTFAPEHGQPAAPSMGLAGIAGVTAMTETAHTPLPWVANDKHSGANPWRIENDEGVYANGGWIIAECMGPDAKANAAFIVQAVNSHHRLVEALRSAIAALEDGTGLDDAICCGGLDCGCRAATHRQLLLHDLTAALKEAGRG